MDMMLTLRVYMVLHYTELLVRAWKKYQTVSKRLNEFFII
jgi:hypothetical protein